MVSEFERSNKQCRQRIELILRMAASWVLQGRARQPLDGIRARSATSYSRTPNDIQFVEHVEGGGAEMYEAVCKLGLEGIVFQESGRTLRIWSSSIVAQNQKSARAGCNSRR